MSILSWIVFGLIAGFVASKLVDDRGQGCITNIALGIVGALVGGFLYHLMTRVPFSFHFGVTSFLVAIGGAIVVLYVFHALKGSGRW